MKVHHFPTTGSTNADLLALARSGEPDGSWVRADAQTAGRGRLGRGWSSPPGNLYASRLVRLRPGDPPPATLALVAAVALEGAVAGHVAPGRLMLKWPNDLLLEGAKLSGILLEAVDGAVVIGFGVNLAAAPDAGGRAVASLKEATGAAPDPDRFLEALEQAFAAWIARWREDGLAPVRERWLARAHPLGAPLATTGPDGQPIAGRFAGLEPDGALRLALDSGETILLHAGDVTLRGGP